MKALMLVLLLAACGSGDEAAPPAAQCMCSKLVGVNAVQTYSCECGSEEHRRFGR